MERLIDANELYVDARFGENEEPYISLYQINSAPTIDAVEVVRCKDCKKYIPRQKLPIGTSKWCGLFDRATCEMNYCGWGERREDAN